MPTCWVYDQIKAKMSYASDVTWLTLGHSKCGMTRIHYYYATNFKAKSPYLLHNRYFLHKSFPIENKPRPWFLGNPEPLIKYNYVFPWIIIFFGCELSLDKTWNVKNVDFNLLLFKRRPYDSDLWLISLGHLNITLSAWNDFPAIIREIFNRLFFLNEGSWK